MTKKATIISIFLAFIVYTTPFIILKTYNPLWIRLSGGIKTFYRVTYYPLRWVCREKLPWWSEARNGQFEAQFNYVYDEAIWFKFHSKNIPFRLDRFPIDQTLLNGDHPLVTGETVIIQYRYTGIDSDWFFKDFETCMPISVRRK